jgi:hypothetical protein
VQVYTKEGIMQYTMEKLQATSTSALCDIADELALKEQ